MIKLEDSLLFRTQETTRKASRVINEILGKHGSTQVQWTALHFLSENPGINQSTLAQLMQIQSSTTVRLIDRMIRDGLVKKDQLSADRRNTVLSCTQKGLELYRQIKPHAENIDSQLSSNITDEETRLFLEILEKFEQNLKTYTCCSEAE
jgi:DNA-binding MarR family transcriptional regulator